MRRNWNIKENHNFFFSDPEVENERIQIQKKRMWMKNETKEERIMRVRDSEG